jgi:hypothetical protein
MATRVRLAATEVVAKNHHAAKSAWYAFHGAVLFSFVTAPGLPHVGARNRFDL